MIVLVLIALNYSNPDLLRRAFSWWTSPLSSAFQCFSLPPDKNRTRQDKGGPDLPNHTSQTLVCVAPALANQSRQHLKDGILEERSTMTSCDWRRLGSTPAVKDWIGAPRLVIGISHVKYSGVCPEQDVSSLDRSAVANQEMHGFADLQSGPQFFETSDRH